MSLVKKTVKKISDKKVKDKKDEQKEKTNKPIEIHTLYKDLIKKNNIFKDLKELNEETEKTTPHFFFHLNDNSNNYLTELKKITDFNPILKLALSKSSLEGEWIKSIIMADIYFNVKDDWSYSISAGSEMNILRIGYCLDKIDREDSQKPPFWFSVNYKHNMLMKDKIYDGFVYKYKSYKQMMTSVIKEVMNNINDKDKEFVKPFGAWTGFKKGKYGFTDNINISSYDRLTY